MRALVIASVLVAVATFTTPAFAQAPDGGRVVVDVQVSDADTGLIDDIDGCPEGQCCKPSTSKQLLMGAGSLFAFVVLFFLMVRLVERVFIRQERSPLLGRHLGMSIALFFGSAIAAGVLYVVTGCWFHGYTYLLVALGLVWLLHFLYTMLAVRK